MGGCSSGDDSGSGASVVPANASSPELLERKYGYLLKEDRDFVRLAPNYSALRPFAPDTAVVVQHHSEVTGQTKPAADFNEFLHVRLNRAMSLRFVIADSTAWATQLRFLAPQLIRTLNTELGHGLVKVVVVKGPSAPSWRKGRRSAPGSRGPRDTYG